MPRDVPAVETVYHLMLFPAEVAFNKEDEPLQIEAGVADIEVGFEGKATTLNAPDTALVTVPQLPVTTQ